MNGTFFFTQFLRYLPVILIFFVLNGYSSENAASNAQATNQTLNVRFALKGKGDLNGYTVLVSGLDLVFNSDQQGSLFSILDSKAETFSVPYGTYTAEIIKAGVSRKENFSIGPDTQDIVYFSVSETRSENKKVTARVTEQISGTGGRSIGSSRQVLSAEEARFIPGTGGDALRSIINLPGVVTTSGFSSGLFIRGGDRFDILYTYDNIRIGNPFHDLGLYSVFAPNSIESVNFYPGGFPVNYGHSQGAVIDVESKTYFKDNKLFADIDVNLFAAGAYFSIPLGPNVRFSIGGRRTYYGFYMRALEFADDTAARARGNKEGGSNSFFSLLSDFDQIPFFYDYNAKLDFQLPRNGGVLSLLGIGAQDKVEFNTERAPLTDSDGKTNFVNFSTDFDNIWNTQGIVYKKQFRTLRVFHTLFRNQSFNKVFFLDTVFSKNETVNYGSVNQYNFQIGKKIELNTGFEYTYQDEKATASEPTPGTEAFFTNTGLSQYEFYIGLTNYMAQMREVTKNPDRHTGCVFLDTVIKDIGPFGVQAGLRGTYNNYSKYVDLDPRIALSVFPFNDTELYVKWGKYSQLPGFFVSSGRGTEFQEPVTKSPYSYHWTAGADFLINRYNIKSELYYKDMRDVILKNPTHDPFFPTDPVTNPLTFNKGYGRAYGAELLIRRKISQGLFGWFSYAISKAERYTFTKQPDSMTLYLDRENNGQDYKTIPMDWHLYSRDQTHNLKLITSWHALPWLKVGGKFSLQSGLPYTETRIYYRDENNNGTYERPDVLYYDEVPDKYNKRYPLKYYIDLRLDFILKIRTLDISLYIDIWNLQDLWHDNVLSYSYRTDMIDYSRKEFQHSIRPGAVPKEAIDERYDLPLLPLIGLQIVF